MRTSLTGNGSVQRVHWVQNEGKPPFAAIDGTEEEHPAQLVLEVRREDKDAARELATQIELAIADHALRIAEGDAAAAPALAGERAGIKLLGPGDG